MIEGKDKGKRLWTGYHLLVGEQWKISDILKISQDRNERILIANVGVLHGTYIGLDSMDW